jgi:LPS-assembly protein
MRWTNFRRPAPGGILLILGFFLHALPARADDAAPVSYRHLDWISKKEIADLPPELRPKHQGLCSGMYFAPAASATTESDNKVRASAQRFDTSADGRLELEGEVLVHQDGRELRSDKVRLDRATSKTELEGNVTIRQPGLLIRGNSARIDGKTNQLDVRDTDYVVHDLHAHGKAGRIHNPGAKQLILDRATYTTCEPDDPTWEIKADRIKLDQASGWGQVRNATVEVGGVPVVYLPWWLFPIDDRRQSGFLFPALGNSSENGITMGLPYYINLAPNYDATVTPTYIGRRGTLVEGEFRYLTDHTEGFLGGGHLANDKLADDEDRDMVTWKHLGNYGRLRNEVDYTEVGDSRYFVDLGTSLEAGADTHLDQRTNLHYFGDTWSAGVNVQQYQTIDDVIADNDLPYRRLPQITADTQLPLAHEPLQLRLGSEYVFFEHPEQGDPDLTVANHADRARLHGSLGYNYRGPWGFVVPRYTYRFRYYNIDGGPLDQQEPNVDIQLFNIDSGLYFDRPFRFLDHDFTQTLEPRVYYLYVPYVEQNDLPLFDTAKNSFGFEQLFRDNRFTGGDRFGDANQVSLGVTSRFIDHDTGQERLNFGIGQIFYLRDREVQLRPQDPVETTDTSPLVARGYWQVNRHWSLRAETQYDNEVNNLDSLVTGVGFRSKSGNLVNLNYNAYDDGAVTADPELEKIRQTDFSFMWTITEKWGLLGRWGYDLEQRRSYDNILGVEYESCCWRARLVNRRYLKESNDDPFAVEAVSGIYLQIELKGLGGVGGDVDKLLEQSISGYQDRETLRPVRY